MRGSQEPRIKIEPERVSTDGDDANALMEAYGLNLDDWQKTVIDCWLGKDKDGHYTMTSGGLALPRQNGKNVCLEAREFFGLIINGEKILHTAHQVRTAKKSFRRLAGMFTDKRHPEVMDTVNNIRYTNGEESIELANGGVIEFSARSRKAARGFDGISLVVYDEAQELTNDQVEAIMSTLSASSTGTRQIIYTGTPPYPNCPGDVFKRRRKVCTSDPGKHDAWHEWSVSAETVEAIKVDDPTLWYMTNPALGIRLSESFTAEECRTMSPDGFARERLGWWNPVEEGAEEYVISAEAWDACRSMTKKPTGKTAYGVKFSADGEEVCLCGAVIPKQGEARISLIERKKTSHGTRWLSDWLNERYKKASCVVIDGRNGVDVLIDRISDTWVMKSSIVRARPKDMIAAVSTLIEMINTQAVTWYAGQPALRESALSATKRKIAGGFGFGGEDSTPIEAAALALWGAKTSRRDPQRKMRIG